MTDCFAAEVESVVGPLLAGLGFTLDEVDNNVDEGGRQGSVVYYEAGDCKVQIYRSWREGSVNCMIAPLDAPNVFGLHDQSYKWQYFTKFSATSNVSLEELVQQVSFEPETDRTQLEWVRDRIAEYFNAAHAGILEME